MRETRHLWIGNLPENVREDRIAEHFKRYGKIDKVRLLPKRSSDNGLSACVAFMDLRSAQKANAGSNVIGDRELMTDYFDPTARGGMSSISITPQTGRSADDGQRHSSQQTPASGHRAREQGHGNRRYDAQREGATDDKLSYERNNRERLSGHDKHRQVGGEEVAADTYDSDRSRSHGDGIDKEKSHMRSSVDSKRSVSSKKHKSENTSSKSSKKKSKKSNEEAKTKESATKKGKLKRVKERGRSPTLKHKKSLSSKNSAPQSPGSSSVASGKRTLKSAASSSEGRSSSTGSGSMSTSGSGRTSSNSSSASSSSTNSSRSHSSNSSSSEYGYEPEGSPNHRKLVAMCLKKLPTRPTVTSLREGIYHEFKKYGKVKSVLVKGDGAERYALVLFRTAAEANKAVNHAKSKLLFGAAIEASIYDGEVSGQEAEGGVIIEESHPRASRTLFVGNLDKTVSYSDIQNIFVRFGEIVAIEIKKQHNVPQYAFLQYTDIASVVRALTKMDGEQLGRNTLKLGFGKTVISSCLWVDGVTDSFTENYLSSCFQRYGHVKHVLIDRNRGQALVFYSEHEFAQAAMAKMRARKLNGSRLKMDYASKELIEIFIKHMQNSGQSIQGLENIRQLLQPPSSPTGSTPAATLPPASSSQHYPRSEMRPYYDDHVPPNYPDYPSSQYMSSSDANYRRGWQSRSRDRYPYPVEQSGHSRHTKRVYEDTYVDRMDYHREHSPPSWEHDAYPDRRTMQSSHYDQDYRHDIRRERSYSRKSSGPPYEEPYHYRSSRERPREPERGRERDRMGEGYAHYPRPSHLSPTHARYVTRRSRSLSPRPRDVDRASLERVGVSSAVYRRRGHSGTRSPETPIDLLRNRKNSVESKSSSHSGSRYTSRTADVDMRDNISPLLESEDKMTVTKTLASDDRMVEFRKKSSKSRVRSKVVIDSPVEGDDLSPKRHHHHGYKSSDAGSDREVTILPKEELDGNQGIEQQAWSPEYKGSYSGNRSRSETPTRDENQDLIGEVIIKQPSSSKSSSRSVEIVRQKDEKKYHHDLERKESRGKPRDKDYRKGFTSDQMSEEYKLDSGGRVREERSSSSKGSHSRSSSSSLLQRVHSPSDLERKSSMMYTKDFDYRKHPVVRTSRSDSAQKDLSSKKSSSRQVDVLPGERGRRRHSRLVVESEDKKSNSSQSPLSPVSSSSRSRVPTSAKLIKREYSPSPSKEQLFHKTRRGSNDRGETERTTKDRDYAMSPRSRDRDDRYGVGRSQWDQEPEDVDERRSVSLKRRHEFQDTDEGSPEVSIKRERKTSTSDGRYPKSKGAHHHHHQQTAVKHEAPMSIARQMFMQEEDESGADSPMDSRNQNREHVETSESAGTPITEIDTPTQENASEQMEIKEEALIVKKRKSRWEDTEDSQDSNNQSADASPKTEFPNVTIAAAKSLLPKRLSKSSTKSSVQETTEMQIEKQMEKIRKEKENKGNLLDLEREKMRLQNLLSKLDSEKLDVKDAEEVAGVVLEELTSKAKSKILATQQPKKPSKPLVSEEESKTKTFPPPDVHEIPLKEDVEPEIVMEEEEIVVDTIEEVTEDEVIEPENEIAEEMVISENTVVIEATEKPDTEEDKVQTMVEVPEDIPVPVVHQVDTKKEEIDSSQGYRKQMEAKKKEMDKIQRRQEHERKKLLRKQEKEKKKQMKRVSAMRPPGQSVISSVDDEEEAVLLEDEEPSQKNQTSSKNKHPLSDQDDDGERKKIRQDDEEVQMQQSDVSDVAIDQKEQTPVSEEEKAKPEATPEDLQEGTSGQNMQGVDSVLEPLQEKHPSEVINTVHVETEPSNENMAIEKPWPPDMGKDSLREDNDALEVRQSEKLEVETIPLENEEAKMKEEMALKKSITMKSEAEVDKVIKIEPQDVKVAELTTVKDEEKVPAKPSLVSHSPLTPSSTDQKTPLSTTPLASNKDPTPSPQSLGNSQSLTPSGSLSSSLSHKSSRTPVTTPSQMTKTPTFTTPSPASSSSTSSSKSLPKQQKQSRNSSQGQHHSSHHQPVHLLQHGKKSAHPVKPDRHSRSRGSSSDQKRRAGQPHHQKGSGSYHNHKGKAEKPKMAHVPAFSRWPMASITVGLDASPSKPLGRSELEKLRKELESVKSQLSLDMSPSSLSPCSGDEESGKSPAQLLSPISPILRSPADSMVGRKLDITALSSSMPGTSPGSTPSLTDRMKLLGRVKKKTPNVGTVVKLDEEKMQPESQKKEDVYLQSRILRSSIFDQDSERLSYVQRRIEEEKQLEDQTKGLNYAASGILFSGSKFLEQTPVTNFSSPTPLFIPGSNPPPVDGSGSAATITQLNTSGATGPAISESCPTQSSISGPKNVHSLSSCELPASAERKALDNAGKECNISTIISGQQTENGQQTLNDSEFTPEVNSSEPPSVKSNQEVQQTVTDQVPFSLEKYDTAITSEDWSRKAEENITKETETNTSDLSPQSNQEPPDSTQVVETIGSFISQDQPQKNETKILPSEDDTTARSTDILTEEQSSEEVGCAEPIHLLEKSQEPPKVVSGPSEAVTSDVSVTTNEVVTEEIVSDLVPAQTSNVEVVGQVNDTFGENMEIVEDMDIYTHSCMEIVETSVENEEWVSNPLEVTEEVPPVSTENLSTMTETLSDQDMNEVKDVGGSVTAEKQPEKNSEDDVKSSMLQQNSETSECVQKTAVPPEKVENPPDSNLPIAKDGQDSLKIDSKPEPVIEQGETSKSSNSSIKQQSSEKVKKQKEESKPEKRKSKFAEKIKKKVEKRESSKESKTSSQISTKQEIDSRPQKKLKSSESSKDGKTVGLSSEKPKDSIKSIKSGTVTSSTSTKSVSSDKHPKPDSKTKSDTTVVKDSVPVVKSKTGSSSEKKKLLKSQSGKIPHSLSKSDSKSSTQRETVTSKDQDKDNPCSSKTKVENVEKSEKSETTPKLGTKASHDDPKVSSAGPAVGDKHTNDAKTSSSKHPGEKDISSTTSMLNKTSKKEDVSSSKERKQDKHLKKDKKLKFSKSHGEVITSSSKSDQKKPKTALDIAKKSSDDKEITSTSKEMIKEEDNGHKHDSDKAVSQSKSDHCEQGVKTLEPDASQKQIKKDNPHTGNKDKELEGSSQGKDTSKDGSSLNILKKKKKKKKQSVREATPSSKHTESKKVKSEEGHSIDSKISEKPHKTEKLKKSKSSMSVKHKATSELRKSSSDITSKSTTAVSGKSGTSKKPESESKKPLSSSKLEKVKKHSHLKPSQSTPVESLSKEKDKVSSKQKIDKTQVKKKVNKSSSLTPGSSQQSRYSQIYDSSSSDSESDTIATKKSLRIALSDDDSEDFEEEKAPPKKDEFTKLDNRESKWSDLDDDVGGDTQRRHLSSSSHSSSSSFSDSGVPPPVVSSSLLVTETIKSETILPPGYDEDVFSSSFYDLDEDDNAQSTGKSKNQVQSKKPFESNTKKKHPEAKASSTPRASHKKERDTPKHSCRRIIMSSSSSDSSDNELVISMSSTSSSDLSEDEEQSSSFWSKSSSKSGKRNVGKRTGPTQKESSQKQLTDDSDRDEEKSTSFSKLNAQKPKDVSSDSKKISSSKTPSKSHESSKTKKTAPIQKSSIDKSEVKSKHDKKSLDKKEKVKSKSSSLDRSSTHSGKEVENASVEAKPGAGGEKLQDKKKPSGEKSKGDKPLKPQPKEKTKLEKSGPTEERKQLEGKTEKASHSHHGKKDASHKHKQQSEKSTSIKSTLEKKNAQEVKDISKPEQEVKTNANKQVEHKKSSSKGKDLTSSSKTSSPSPGTKKEHGKTKDKQKTELKHQTKHGIHKKKKVKKEKSHKNSEKPLSHQDQPSKKPTVTVKPDPDPKPSTVTSHPSKEDQLKALTRSLFSSDSDDVDDDVTRPVKVEPKPPVSSFPEGTDSEIPKENLSKEVCQHMPSPKKQKTTHPALETPKDNHDSSKVKKTKSKSHPTQERGLGDLPKHHLHKHRSHPTPPRLPVKEEQRRGSAESFLTTSTTDESDAEQRIQLQTVISSLEKDDDFVSADQEEFADKNEPGDLEIVEDFPSEEEMEKLESFVHLESKKEIKMESEEKEVIADITQKEKPKAKSRSPAKSPKKHSDKSSHSKHNPSHAHEKSRKTDGKKESSGKKHKRHQDSHKQVSTSFQAQERPGRFGEKRSERMDRIKTHSHERDEEAVRSIVGLMDESSDADSYFSDVKSETEVSHRSGSLGGLTPDRGRKKRRSRDSDISSGSSNITKPSTISVAASTEPISKLESDEKSVSVKEEAADTRTTAEENELAAAVSSIEGLFGDFEENKSMSMEDLSSSKQDTSYLDTQQQLSKQEAVAPEEHTPAVSEMRKEMSQEELERGSNEAALAASALLLEDNNDDDNSYFGYQPTTTRMTYSRSADNAKEMQQEEVKQTPEPESVQTGKRRTSDNENFSFETENQETADIELPSIRSDRTQLSEDAPMPSASNTPSTAATSATISSSRKRQRSSRGGASSSGRSSSRESKSDWSVSDTSESELLQEPGKSGRRKGKGAKQRKVDKSLSPNVHTSRNDSYDFDSDVKTQTLSLPKLDGPGETMPFVTTTTPVAPPLLSQPVNIQYVATSTFSSSAPATAVVTSPAAGSFISSTTSPKALPTLPVRPGRKTSWDTDVFSPAGAKRRSSSSSSSAHSPSRGSQFSQLTPPSSAPTHHGLPHMAPSVPASYAQASPFVSQVNVTLVKTDTQTTFSQSQMFPTTRPPMPTPGMPTHPQPSTAPHLSPKTTRHSGPSSYAVENPRAGVHFTPSIHAGLPSQPGIHPPSQIPNKTPPHAFMPRHSSSQMVESANTPQRLLTSSSASLSLTSPKVQHITASPAQPVYLTRTGVPQSVTLARTPGVSQHGNITNLTSMPGYPTSISLNLSSAGTTNPAGMQQGTTDSIPASLSSFSPAVASLTSPPLHPHQFAHARHPPGSQAPVQVQTTVSTPIHHHIGVPTYPHHSAPQPQVAVRNPVQSPHRPPSHQETLVVRPEVTPPGGPRSLPRPTFTQPPGSAPQTYPYQIHGQVPPQAFQSQPHQTFALRSPTGHPARPGTTAPQTSPGAPFHGFPATPQQQGKAQSQPAFQRTPSNPYLPQQTLSQAATPSQIPPTKPSSHPQGSTSITEQPQQGKPENSEVQQKQASTPVSQHAVHPSQASPKAEISSVYGNPNLSQIPQVMNVGARPRHMFPSLFPHYSQHMIQTMPGAFHHQNLSPFNIQGHPLSVMGQHFLPGQPGIPPGAILRPTTQQIEEMNRHAARMQAPPLKPTADKNQPQAITQHSQLQTPVRTPTQKEPHTPTSRSTLITSPMSQHGSHIEPASHPVQVTTSNVQIQSGHFRPPAPSSMGHPYRPPLGDRIVHSQTDVSQQDMVDQHFIKSGIRVPRHHSPVAAASTAASQDKTRSSATSQGPPQHTTEQVMSHHLQHVTSPHAPTSSQPQEQAALHPPYPVHPGIFPNTSLTQPPPMPHGVPLSHSYPIPGLPGYQRPLDMWPRAGGTFRPPLVSMPVLSQPSPRVTVPPPSAQSQPALGPIQQRPPTPQHSPVGAPASQLQQTPPPSSTPKESAPDQNNSVMDLFQRYPVIWQGLLALKNDSAPVQTHYICGDIGLAQACLPKPNAQHSETDKESDLAVLRIVQRMRLEPPHLEGVDKRMMNDSDFCLLLALPCGRDKVDVIRQQNALKEGFIDYLRQKQAAGIVNVQSAQAQGQVQYVLHVFPPCDFTTKHLQRRAQDLLSNINDIQHIMIVIAAV